MEMKGFLNGNEGLDAACVDSLRQQRLAKNILGCHDAKVLAHTNIKNSS